MEIEKFAKELHNYYEERAEVNNWETQKSCKVEFEDLPQANKQTMIDLASYIKSVESLTITKLQKEIDELKEENTTLKKQVEDLQKEKYKMWEIVCGYESKYIHKAFHQENHFAKRTLPIWENLKKELKQLLKH